MFSVNIDKLIDVSSTELDTYKDLAENVIKELNGEKTFAVITGGMGAFKLAYCVHLMGKKVLFIDADISSDIFVGKYKLGKNIAGVMDFLRDVDKAGDIVCHTNKEDFDVIFTGNIDGDSLNNDNELIMKGLIDSYSKIYDLVLVDSDISGIAAKYSSAAVVMVDENHYIEDEVEKYTEKLEALGCNILGVVLNEWFRTIFKFS